MQNPVDIRELQERVERESSFVDALTLGMNQVIVGQKHLVESLLIGLLSDGHILLEGVPGLAKTLAIKTLSDLIKANFSRIQFTPDLLPADVIGTQIYSQKSEEFKIKRGPIFANFVLADEINRAPADPIKQNTAEYTYTFNGWDHAIAQVQGPQTYKATFTATKNSYTITWQNEDGSLIDQTIVEYGQIPAHANPVKQNTAEYTYSFAGWTPAVVAVTGNATYKATFTATKNSYTITWQNEDGLLIGQTTVEYGVVPTHTDPIKQNTAEYTYTFSGWTPAVVAVTGDATYRATFSATKNSYTITWQDENGSLIDQTTVEYGQIPAHADPVKQNTAEYTYTFAGWTPSVVAVTGDATYRATFTATKNSYTITWQNEDGSLIDQTTVEYGVTPTHADPIKTNTAEYTYTFAGWTPSVVAVTGDATYRATFNSEVNMYSITSNTINGSVEGLGVYAYGTEIELIAIPDEGFVFDQWNDGITDNPRTIIVTNDAEYTAIFIQSQGVDGVYVSDPVQKVIIDDKVYILRGDMKYTITGQEVK